MSGKWAVPVIASILVLVSFPLNDAFAVDPPPFDLKWGSFGSGDGEFDQPTGIVVDSDDNVYVTDTNNHRIQKFDSSGTFDLKWGSQCSLDSPVPDCVDPDLAGPLELGDGQFQAPNGVTVDSDDNVYVLDGGNQRIQKFDSSGTFLTKWGSFGTGDGEFDQPTGIAADSDDNVYVADSGNDRIQKFDSSGTFLTKLDGIGSGDGEFDVPVGVAVDSAGNLYVADSSNNRIQKFDSSGTFDLKWGSSGSGDGEFEQPFDVAVDSSGNVYVVDLDNTRIQKFDSSGTFLTKWGSFCFLLSEDGCVDPDLAGPLELGDGQFDTPNSVAVDSAGNVYVVDSSNNRIQKFAETPIETTPKEATENSIAELDDIIIDLVPDVEDKAQDALEKLEQVEIELNNDPPDNQAAAGNIEGAIGDLEAAVDKEEDSDVQDELIELMDTLAGIVKQLALDAIDEAVATDGSDGDKIDTAGDKLKEGDDFRDDGKFKDAASKYKDALSEAEGALP